MRECTSQNLFVFFQLQEKNHIYVDYYKFLRIIFEPMEKCATMISIQFPVVLKTFFEFFISATHLREFSPVIYKSPL